MTERYGNSAPNRRSSPCRQVGDLAARVLVRCGDEGRFARRRLQVKRRDGLVSLRHPARTVSDVAEQSAGRGAVGQGVPAGLIARESKERTQ